MTFLKMVGLTFLFLVSVAAAIGGTFLALSMVEMFFESLNGYTDIGPVAVVAIFFGGLLLTSIGVVGAGWSAAKTKDI